MRKKSFLKNKTILVVGGTGSWGTELCTQILQDHKDFKKLIIYSRGEHKQVEMSRQFPNRKVEFVIGDIRDLERLMYVTKEVDIVFHLAALKHVPVCERHVDETVKTNIQGTLNLIDACKYNEVEKCILVSTDKAADPINAYGASKFLAEKAIIAADASGSKTRFYCVRAGNVLGSQGSVIPLFRKQLLEAKTVTLTSPKMTRYIMTLRMAIRMVLDTLEFGNGGEIFVTRMKSFQILELVEAIAAGLKIDSYKIKEIGIRPGEKYDEVLLTQYEAERAVRFKNYYVVLPTLQHKKHLKWGKKFVEKQFNSRDNEYFSVKELVKIIGAEGWFGENTPEDIFSNLAGQSILKPFEREKWLTPGK